MKPFDFPKIELHLHLDGAMRPETMWELALEKGVPLPTDTPAAFRAWLKTTADCRDVNEYLKRFELPLRLLQDGDSLRRAARELAEDLALAGLSYAEIRFAPQLHTREKLKQRDAVLAVAEGIRDARKTHPEFDAGVLLCAMSIGPETLNMAENLETVRLTAEFLGRDIIGLDLAGAEGIVPLRNFAPVFDLARQLGVPFTCHAGDSQGPDTVLDALNFGAKRIGHGHHIYDAPELWPRAIRDGVTLEICPTSNIQCRTQPGYALHPAKKLLDAGLRVTVSTDNRTLACVTLDDEYRHCVEEMGFTRRDLIRMNLYAVEASFMPAEKKAELTEKLLACRAEED